MYMCPISVGGGGGGQYPDESSQAKAELGVHASLFIFSQSLLAKRCVTCVHAPSNHSKWKLKACEKRRWTNCYELLLTVHQRK